MTQTRVKIKGPPPLPDLDGYPTGQRLSKASHGVSVATAPNEPSYINAPLLSESAPNFVLPGPLDKALKAYEKQKLFDYWEAYNLHLGEIRGANYEGTPAPKGKMSGGRLPPYIRRKDTAFLYGWFSEITGQTDFTRNIGLAEYRKCGLEFFCRVMNGEGDYQLEDIGLAMCRLNDKMAKIGSYISFYAGAVQCIYEAERKISQKRRELRYLKQAEAVKSIKRITGG
ncbi:MAG: hypothetical protein DHS20C08_04470 [Rhodomicrobium sp.]|nr:MAG: hypothetical protein DHS20C08_04470 [Rhodomicrobium sp.]